MLGWGGVGNVGVGWVMQEWGGSCKGGVGHLGVGLNEFFSNSHTTFYK